MIEHQEKVLGVLIVLFHTESHKGIDDLRTAWQNSREAVCSAALMGPGY